MSICGNCQPNHPCDNCVSKKGRPCNHHAPSLDAQLVYGLVKVLLQPLKCNVPCDNDLCKLAYIECSSCDCTLTNGQLARLVAASVLESVAFEHATIGNIDDGNMKFSGVSSSKRLSEIACKWRSDVMACCKKPTFAIARTSRRKRIGMSPRGTSKCCGKSQCGCGDDRVRLCRPVQNCNFNCCYECDSQKMDIHTGVTP